MLHIQYMKYNDYHVWVIYGSFFSYLNIDGRDNIISARAMKNRLHRLFSVTPSVKEIKTSSDTYTIECDILCPNLVEILKTLESMSQHLTNKEYCHAEEELYEGKHPHEDRMRTDGYGMCPIIIPWETYTPK